jgi:hypothetical protein
MLTHLHLADGSTVDATHAAFYNWYDEGIYAACVAVLGAATSRAEPPMTPEHFTVLNAVTNILFGALDKSEALRPVLRQYILAQSGALAGVALAARIFTDEAQHTCSTAFLAWMRHDSGLKTLPGLRLLDTQFAACAVMQLRVTDAALVGLFVADWRSATCLQALSRPLTHQALPAAMSLACLATEDACFRKLLTKGKRLEMLSNALVAAADCRHYVAAAGLHLNPAVLQQQPGLWWQLLVFRHAIKSAANGAQLTAPAPVASEEASTADEPGAKRRRTSHRGVALSAADVNVRRRDSTVLLIGGQPFYAHGAALEAHSAVLADALRDAETLEPVALPLPAGVPAELHYALFRDAVEHAYTGGITADMSAEELLPLFCLAADGQPVRMVCGAHGAAPGARCAHA